jgi:hypothetical protein
MADTELGQPRQPRLPPLSSAPVPARLLPLAREPFGRRPGAGAGGV